MENQSSAENNSGEVDHQKIRPRDDECRQETLKTATHEEFLQLLRSQHRKWHDQSRRRRQIHIVPPQLRLRRQQSKHVYDPVMVSLGPYHHGKPELRQAEEFKYLCLDWCALGNEEKKGFFYDKVLEKIDVIRSCYAEVSIVEKYDDKALALMMLLDACFIINFMENCTETKRDNVLDWNNCLGVAAVLRFTFCDMVVLENQIPFLVIKLLFCLQYGKQEGEELLEKFLRWAMHVDLNQARIPREDEEPPLHILEACRRVIVGEHYTEQNQQVDSQLLKSKFRWPRVLMSRKKKDVNVSCTSCSVTDLKAKGIHFRPSSLPSLKDITFKSHAFYGQLQLPCCHMSDLTQVIVSNMIAYEILPNTKTDPVVLSFTNFMKSLIQSPADVKELQEKGILFNMFANHEQVVKVIKEIDTFGLLNFDFFGDVKQRVGEHCSNRAKTWIADLIHTRFKTPWTVIALLAATFLRCFTFLQTLFTIHPVNRIN